MLNGDPLSVDAYKQLCLNLPKFLCMFSNTFENKTEDTAWYRKQLLYGGQPQKHHLNKLWLCTVSYQTLASIFFEKAKLLSSLGCRATKSVDLKSQAFHLSRS